MNTVCPVPGSFRDPSGRVYRLEDRIFRTVSNRCFADFELVESTKLIKKLASRGVVLPAERVNREILGPVANDACCVLEIPTIPLISFPYEWPFPALKAAALLHLEVHLAALEHGVTLSDASAYNVQFLGARPIFIDHLSFRPYRNGEIWTGYRQFCEQFLNPLLLRALLGVNYNGWYRGTQEGIPASDLCRLMKWRHYVNWNSLVHVVMHSFFQRTAQNNKIKLDKQTLGDSALPLSAFRRMLQRLHKWISKLEPSDTGKTIWRDYNQTNSYSLQEAEVKKRLVKDFVSKIKPKVLWDLGCNIGEHSQAALEAGAEYTVGFDSDQGALELGFVRAREQRLPFLPLYMDLANPTPNQGWMEKERDGLQARATADAVLALALVHHLTIARNIPLDDLIHWIISLARRGIIEFIPKNDPMVQILLRSREDIFPNYTKEYFLDCVAQQAKVIRTETVSESGRVLVWYERS